MQKWCFEDLQSKRALLSVGVSLALGCSAATTPAPTKDASVDVVAGDAAFDCTAKLLELDGLRKSASVCLVSDACDATIADFCCPIYVVNSASDGAQAYRQALDAYRRAGCPGTLCSAKACTTTPSCVTGYCAQP